ncbi:hypothetical protein EKO27_g23 [Xylaria grammica]|uniref:Uncharacterized protein n=1 Tax=Xylaria grammica TaxID=363999 RepID=A0A439DKQ6_9PEZI|nr:hypothetical protein EKO27_g23 [Xylaria grammica]
MQSKLLEGHKEFLEEMRDWRVRVDADVANRVQCGDTEGAERILTEVVAKLAVYFKIIASDDPDLSPGDLDRRDRYEREERDIRRFMSFATQLPSRIRPTTLPTPTISISDVMSQKQWILWNDDGTAVVIRCSCLMIAARMHRRGKESTTHELVPRLFHTDPTDCNLEGDHFRSAHGVHGNDGQTGSRTKYSALLHSKVRPGRVTIRKEADIWSITGLPEDATPPELIPAEVEAIVGRRVQWGKDERPMGFQYLHDDDLDNARERVDEYDRMHPQVDARDVEKLRALYPELLDMASEDEEDAEAAPAVASPPRKRRRRL